MAFGTQASSFGLERLASFYITAMKLNELVVHAALQFDIGMHLGKLACDDCNSMAEHFTMQ